MKKLLFLILLLSACAAPPRAMQATQVLGTATNTPYSMGTEFVTIFRTPVPTCAPCFYIPLGTLTPTPQGIAMTNYITTQTAQLFNNSGMKVEVWPAGKPFSTGEWVKDGRLFLGTFNDAWKNRWIPVGTYKVAGEVTPPPDEPPPPTLPVGAIEQRRYSLDDGATWSEWEYWKKYDN